MRREAEVLLLLLEAEVLLHLAFAATTFFRQAFPYQRCRAARRPLLEERLPIVSLALEA